MAGKLHSRRVIRRPRGTRVFKPAETRRSDMDSPLGVDQSISTRSWVEPGSRIGQAMSLSSLVPGQGLGDMSDETSKMLRSLTPCHERLEPIWKRGLLYLHRLQPRSSRSLLVATSVSTKALVRGLGRTRHDLEPQTTPAGSQGGRRRGRRLECLGIWRHSGCGTCPVWLLRPWLHCTAPGRSGRPRITHNLRIYFGKGRLRRCSQCDPLEGVVCPGSPEARRQLPTRGR